MIAWNTFETFAEYEAFRYQTLLKVEETGVPRTLPYLDGVQIPTMGVGFNLRVGANLDDVLFQMGFREPELRSAAEKTYVDLIRAALGLGYTAGQESTHLQPNLDAVMTNWAADTAVTARVGMAKRNTFSLSVPEIEAAFGAIVRRYEDLLTPWEAKHGIGVEPDRGRTNATH